MTITAHSRHLLVSALDPRLCAIAFLFAPLFALLSYPIHSAEAQSNRAEMHAAEGLALAKAGNLQSAELELRQAVVLAPENVTFLEDLGTVLAMQKKFDESNSYLQRALTMDPSDLLARRYVAANLWQLHRYAEAQQNLRILLRASPDDPQGLLLLGMVSENTRDYATAARALSSVPALVRAQPESMAALARSYYHIGENQKARAWLNELQTHPAGVRAGLLGVQIADEMHDYETAEALLSSLAARYPDESAVRYQLALVEFDAHKFEESRQILQQLLEGGHGTREVDHLLALCLEAQGRREDAIHTLQNAIQLDPGDQASYLDLANLLLAEKQISAALDLAHRMTKTFPDSPRVFVSVGSIQLHAQDFSNAVTSFSRAAQLDPASADAVIGLARAQTNAGMSHEAKATLHIAMQRFTQKAPFELELGQVLMKEAENGTGDKHAEVKAKELFNSAIAHDGKLADAHYELGELALRRGDLAAALVHLKMAAKLTPSSANTHFALSRVYRRLGQEQQAAKEIALFEKLKQ